MKPIGKFRELISIVQVSTRVEPVKAMLIMAALVMSMFILAVLAPSVVVPAAFGADEFPNMAVLQESKPLVTRAGAWQTWNDHIQLKPGQERLPLRISFLNGADGRPKVTDMKVLLDRKPLADFRDFNGGSKFSIDLTGKLHPGNNSLAVQGFGPSGAWMNWKVFIQRPIIASVTPDLLGAGDTVTISGTHFSGHADRLNVHIADKHAKPISCSDQEIKFKMPNSASAGKRGLMVSHYTVRSAPFAVLVNPSAPHIAKIDMLSSPPQHPVTLTGSGFSPNKSDNVVTFGGHKAEVTAATATSITCIIPDMHFPQWNVPVKVVTHGAASKEHITINVDVRVIEKDTVLGP